MSFNVLMYHEFRERGTFDSTKPSTISVEQNYQDAFKMDPIEWTLKKVPSIGSIFVYLYRKI